MKNTLKVLLIAVLLLAPASLFAQTYAIRNTKIVTGTGQTIPNGHILIQDGKITAVGTNISIPRGATVIDGKGLTAYPGMIDPHTSLGLTEVGSVGATQDTSELGDFNPHIKASAAVNALSEHVGITRETGVTTVMAAPGGGLFAGQTAVLNLNGWVTKDMLVKDSAGTIINFPRDVDMTDDTLIGSGVWPLEVPLTGYWAQKHPSELFPPELAGASRFQVYLYELGETFDRKGKVTRYPSQGATNGFTVVDPPGDPPDGAHPAGVLHDLARDVNRPPERALEGRPVARAHRLNDAGK